MQNFLNESCVTSYSSMNLKSSYNKKKCGEGGKILKLKISFSSYKMRISERMYRKSEAYVSLQDRLNLSPFTKDFRGEEQQISIWIFVTLTGSFLI